MIWVIWLSNRPSVFGLVIMNTAVRSSSLAFRSSRSTRPCGVALDRDGLEPGEGGAGRVGAVGAVGDEDPLPLRLLGVPEMGGGDEEGRQFALGPGRRLERAGVQAGDFAQVCCIS